VGSGSSGRKTIRRRARGLRIVVICVVTFPRLPDHRRAFALVERDDGTVYRLDGGVAGSRLPHDIVHLVVERELGIGDGIWAGIAAGLVFRSMTHLSGRHQPHAAERSRDLLRDFGERGLRAELLADLVTSAAALNDPSPARITRLAADRLAVLPDGDARADPARIMAAAAALQVEAARWARLRVGEELCYEWPGRPPGRCVSGSRMPIASGRQTANRERERTVNRQREQAASDRTSYRAAVAADRARGPDLAPLAACRCRRAGRDRASVAGSSRAVDALGDSRLRPGIGCGVHRAFDTGLADGSVYNYAIVGGSLAGSCGLMRRIGPGGMEIGYWVAKDQTRRGPGDPGHRGARR